MRLSWNEIRARAIVFGREWAGVVRERSESQTFWNEFFKVFGRSRRHVAAYEEPVKNLKGNQSFIDLLWPGTMISEHKSYGQSLEKAESQAYGYVRGLMDAGRHDEVPRYIVVSDFDRIALHDTEEDRKVVFRVRDLHEHIREFAFVAGYKQAVAEPEDAVNIDAAERLAKLKDALSESGYPEHELEQFMVRILFCLFAEDTGLLGEPDAFRLYLENTTKEDGSDLGLHLANWFEVLNQPDDKRSKNLDEQLAGLQYVNGDLFADRLTLASFTAEMRNRLLECCRFDWSKISPAVFGSLFQSIMTAKARRQIGAHYTTERDILKVVNGLFLDDLRARFEKHRKNPDRLKELHRELGAMRLLDPACGCGNFLVVAYRELRRLEVEIVQALNPGNQDRGDLFSISAELRVDVHQMHGIELEEWPARIAQVALWLVDHQMNVESSLRFGQAFVRLPLTHAAKIECANALEIDWNDVLPAAECTYILGYPPFVGKKERNPDQKKDMARVWGKTKGAGTLDYVTAWYKRAAEYATGPYLRAAFVSTNSITQGEQVGVFWDALYKRHGIVLDFAYRTFPWESEARGKAQVHVVIIGFSFGGRRQRCIYETTDPELPPVRRDVTRISPYLTEGEPVAVKNRTKALNAPKIHYGSFALDDGNYTLTDEERAAIVAACPEAEAYLPPFLGAKEMLHNTKRFCVWLRDLPAGKLDKLPPIRDRVQAVQKWRASRGRDRTVELAATPHLFAEIRQPSGRYLAIPTVSSERRHYIPIAYLTAEVIGSNQLYVIPDASPYEFGVVHSEMHMAWVRHVCGRIKSDFRYSARLVYNNFPWPDATDEQRQKVAQAAEGVLAARRQHPGASLADLYDPLAMPQNLFDAHAKLDRVVDRCYRSQPFPDERRRFEYLFERWEQLDQPLATTPKRKRD